MLKDLTAIVSKVKKSVFNAYPKYFSNFDEAEIIYIDKKQINNTLSQLDLKISDLLNFEYNELVVMPPSENLLWLMYSPSYHEMDEEQRQRFEDNMNAELRNFAEKVHITEEQQQKLKDNYIKTLEQGMYSLYHFNRSLLETHSVKFNTFEYYPTINEFKYLYGAEFSYLDLKVIDNSLNPDINFYKFAFTKHYFDSIVRDSNIIGYFAKNSKHDDPFFPEGYINTNIIGFPDYLKREIKINMMESMYDLTLPNAIINTKLLLTVEESTKISEKDLNKIHKTKQKKPYLMPQKIKHIIDIDIFNKAVIDKSNANAGTGSKKSPHYRRGHIRRLPSGKLTFVRPSFIGAKTEHLIGKKIYKVKI